jgi:hypothetical protein
MFIFGNIQLIKLELNFSEKMAEWELLLRKEMSKKIFEPKIHGIKQTEIHRLYYFESFGIFKLIWSPI